jgi:serpin B
MKRRLCMCLSLTILFWTVWANGLDAREHQAIMAAAANNAFGFDLFQRLVDSNQGKNVFLSPYSISSALAMSYAGARGKTAREMAAALRYGDASDAIHPAFRSLTEDLQKSGQKGCRLYVANALWGQQDYSFQKEFLGLVDRHYAGGFNTVDYIGATETARQRINQWIMQHTAEKIKELIARGDLDVDTRLVLTNAIYFKGDWTRRFSEQMTRKNPFWLESGQAVDVPMMADSGVYSYAEPDDSLQVLELPYEGDALTMVVLLPRKGRRALEQDVTSQNLAAWLSALHQEEVELFLPKFKFQSKFYLKKTLKSMGMHDAFDERADFSAMTGRKDLYIGKVIHQADIEVNEEGTEAAAATAVIMQRKSVPQRVVFRADHPFIFLIRHKPTGTILFMGKVMNPDGEKI